ncbi:hypothetical protein HJFPF1_05683 [Paramyrothecium foliicola]|nr:hypothetical protein HJFPF1_05683 [Paramyrothecium foliicola]
MIERSYAEKLTAVIDRVKGLGEDIKSSNSPREAYQTKRDALQKRVDELFESDDPRGNKEKIGQCFYDLKNLDEDFKATANEQEATFQQSRKRTTIALFNELFAIIGPSLVKDVLKSHGDLFFRQSSRPSSAERRGSATSQSQRRTSGSIEAPSLDSTDMDLDHDVGIATPNRDGPSPGRTAPKFPRSARANTEVLRGRSRARSPSNPDRVTSFDDVYQGGLAKSKHLIIEYPKQSGLWYIVKCEKHNKRFYGEQPLAGACRHVTSKAHNESGAHDDVIRLLGVQVRDCNQELADKNNQAVRDSLSLDFPFPGSAQSKKSKGKKRRREDEADLSDGIDWANDAELPHHRNSRRNDGIADPVVGDVYSVYWQGDRRWYAGVVLSAKDRVQLNLPTLYQTGLLDMETPDCYAFDAQHKICGWASDYEDGGPRATERLFPILFFDRDKFPESCHTAWVNSRNIKPFENVTKDLPFRRQVEQYLSKQQKEPASSKIVVHFGDQVTRVQSDIPPAAGSAVDGKSTATESRRPSSQRPSPALRTPIQTLVPEPSPTSKDPGSTTQGENTTFQQAGSSANNTRRHTKVESPTVPMQTISEPPRFQPAHPQPTRPNSESHPPPTATGRMSPPNQPRMDRPSFNQSEPPISPLDRPPTQPRLSIPPFQRPSRPPGNFEPGMGGYMPESQRSPASTQASPTAMNPPPGRVNPGAYHLNPPPDRSASTGPPNTPTHSGPQIPPYLHPFVAESKSNAEAFVNRLSSFTPLNANRKASQ